jgi:hypothetical protein
MSETTSTFSLVSPPDATELKDWLAGLFGSDAGYQSAFTSAALARLRRFYVPRTPTGGEFPEATESGFVLEWFELTNVQFGGLGLVAAGDLANLNNAIDPAGTALRDPTPVVVPLSDLTALIAARLSAPDVLSLIFDTTDRVSGMVYEIGLMAQAKKQMYAGTATAQGVSSNPVGLVPVSQVKLSGAEYLHLLIRLNPVTARVGEPRRFAVNILI